VDKKQSDEQTAMFSKHWHLIMYQEIIRKSLNLFEEKYPWKSQKLNIFINICLYIILYIYIYIYILNITIKQ